MHIFGVGPGDEATRSQAPPSFPSSEKAGGGSLSSPMAQLHVVTSQFVMFISCALRARIENGMGSRLDSCEVNFDLQLALVLQVVLIVTI